MINQILEKGDLGFKGGGLGDVLFYLCRSFKEHETNYES